MPANYTIHDFSKHLFWDTDRSTLDFDRSKAQIIQQVLEYGQLEDWKIVQAVYNKDTLREVTTNLRSLDDVTLAFIAAYLNLDKTAFRCYTKKQSAHDFWNL
ncbi:MAG: hypothetical protein EA392_14190 [Cryomorphaceae bacterium]|nr:MAG: hypothetical protein EA392_14190 [Cryomorphaceae bacterium]